MWSYTGTTLTILILDTRHSKIENREPRIDFCVIKIKKGATHCFTGVQSSELAKKFTDNDLAEIKENKLKKLLHIWQISITEKKHKDGRNEYNRRIMQNKKPGGQCSSMQVRQARNLQLTTCNLQLVKLPTWQSRWPWGQKSLRHIISFAKDTLKH